MAKKKPDLRWLYVIAAVAMFVCGGCRAADLRTGLPDPAMTPGEANPVLTEERICAPGFRTGPFRKVPASLKRKVYRTYGMANHKGACACKRGCEVDHLVSLELGGANTAANLWPQPYCGPHNAVEKDKLENRLRELVCAGDLTLEEAQAEISADWISGAGRNRPLVRAKPATRPAGTNREQRLGALAPRSYSCFSEVIRGNTRTIIMSKGTKRYENPPPKTSAPVKHSAGQALRGGNRTERSLAASVERHIEPRKSPKK